MHPDCSASLFILPSFIMVCFWSYLDHQGLTSYCPVPSWPVSGPPLGPSLPRARRPRSCLASLARPPRHAGRGRCQHRPWSCPGPSHFHVPAHNMLLIQQQFSVHSKHSCKYAIILKMTSAVVQM